MKNTNIDTLKKKIDKVHLKHIRPTPDTATTIAILVKDKVAYVGVSKCHEGDQFNREIGRNIAFGRALSLIEDGKSASQTRFTLAVDERDTQSLMVLAQETLENQTAILLTQNKE